MFAAYVRKDSGEDDLLRTIRATHAGHSYFSPLIARDVDDGYELLTVRERTACASWRKWMCTAQANSC